MFLTGDTDMPPTGVDERTKAASPSAAPSVFWFRNVGGNVHVRIAKQGADEHIIPGQEFSCSAAEAVEFRRDGGNKFVETTNEHKS